MNGTDHDFIFTCHVDLPWTPSKSAQGVEVKNLGKANGRAMQLVRFQPGASFPAHLHTDVEFLFVLEGEVLQNGHKLHAGCSTVAPAGTYDTEFISPSGCTFLLVYALSTSQRFNTQALGKTHHAFSWIDCRRCQTRELERKPGKTQAMD